MTEAKERLPNSFYETSITLILRSKTLPNKDNCTPISLMKTDAKIPKKTANLIQQGKGKIIHYYQVRFFPSMQDWVNI